MTPPDTKPWLARLLIGLVLGATALLAVSAPASAKPTVSDDEPGILIVGGGEASQDYSFMASIQNDRYGHVCGASLISDQWLVTAAHCTGFADSVRLGSTDRNFGGEVIAVEEAINHPNYRGGQYDIALLKLVSPVDFAPVSLASTKPGPGTDTRLLGWGQTCPEYGCDNGSRYLKELDTQVLSSIYCDGDGRGDLCIQGSTSDTACKGDSGGPSLVLEGGTWRLAGATSRDGDSSGQGVCGSNNVIYTSVNAHLKWIKRVSGV